MNIYGRLLNFLCQLEQESIHYTLKHNREDAVMVLIAVPMQHWEIEFFSDGHIEIETYISCGVKSGDAAEAELGRFWHENRELPAVQASII